MIETTIHRMLDYVWAMTGKVDPEKFAIGVDEESWKRLIGEEDPEEVRFIGREGQFLIVPLVGMPDETVALVWRNA